MTDYLPDTPCVARAYCPGCEPDADPSQDRTVLLDGARIGAGLAYLARFAAAFAAPIGTGSSTLFDAAFPDLWAVRSRL